MADNTIIKSFDKVEPMIYAYNTPGVTYHDGWTKIGYTEQGVDRRINQQTHTAGIRWVLAWSDDAKYTDGSNDYFKDTDFHNYLEKEASVERERYDGTYTEWFKIDGVTSKGYFDTFASRSAQLPSYEQHEYILRDEQAAAVEKAKAYFENGGEKFLWNAKPRFGKTLSCYDLIRRMGFKKVLIVTNRPKIANSWAEDFRKFIGWRDELCFVTDNNDLRTVAGTMTRDEYVSSGRSRNHGMVAFESLQGLKGSIYFGGSYPKLEWMAKDYRVGNERKEGMLFDLLVIDESHEGVDTMLTEAAFRNIARKHTLYLSGTPFKALARGQFSDEQIYNWSYADEQERKMNWKGEGNNPYADLPRMSLFTYQLSNMIFEQIQQGADIRGDGDTVDYAFDLNEFFATNDRGCFVHEDEVKKFLKALGTQKKYPFSTPELRKELAHTMWYLNRVQSCRALAKLLKEDPVFQDYEVVIAAGDGRAEEENDERNIRSSYDRVKDAIKHHAKTITLTVGQLTTGVTIPEWSGVLMLCNLSSPALYIQAAFRSQNPYMYSEGEECYRKENAYVFDFDPARTLIIFDEYANNLLAGTASGRGTSNDRKENIKRMINFFPVIGEDTDGEMVELDAAKVMSIPRKIKCTEVVRRGFMSNLLFQNIGNVFAAPAAVREILEKITPAQEENFGRNDASLEELEDIHVNEENEIEIPSEIVIGKTQEVFGPAIYETLENVISVPEIDHASTANEVKEKFRQLTQNVKEKVEEHITKPATEQSEITGNETKRITNETNKKIEKEFGTIQLDYEIDSKIAETKRDEALRVATTDKEKAEAESAYKAAMEAAAQSVNQKIQEATQKIIEEQPRETVQKIEETKEAKKKRDSEDEIRAHLRGFARTIPSFIMAYGDDDLTLGSFDKKTEANVFLEVTGITVEQFKFLRDGGPVINPETGREENFAGHLFDEVVFNDSVKEFMKKKKELADYFDESHTEDIFDYIPPQKTNQIFTPKWVVKKMVNLLEEENPGCFDDPSKTFADLYMKSGLYIAEIIKRLYNSEKMKEYLPDGKERIRHILKKQVYGIAPTRIIYLIATNFILGFDESLKEEYQNFKQRDTAEAAKNGTLQQVVDNLFE